MNDESTNLTRPVTDVEGAILALTRLKQRWDGQRERNQAGKREAEQRGQDALHQRTQDNLFALAQITLENTRAIGEMCRAAGAGDLELNQRLERLTALVERLTPRVGNSGKE